MREINRKNNENESAQHVEHVEMLFLFLSRKFIFAPNAKLNAYLPSRSHSDFTNETVYARREQRQLGNYN